MKAGKLRHLVQLQQPVNNTSDSGDLQTGWAAFGDPFWARVVPLSGRDFFSAKQINSDISHRVELRWRPGIQPNMRVLHDGRVLELVSPPINVDERDREVHLMCRELTPPV